VRLRAPLVVLLVLASAVTTACGGGSVHVAALSRNCADVAASTRALPNAGSSDLQRVERVGNQLRSELATIDDERLAAATRKVLHAVDDYSAALRAHRAEAVTVARGDIRLAAGDLVKVCGGRLTEYVTG
jgi:hypothetical protein